jgi:hypothetical protein
MVILVMYVRKTVNHMRRALSRVCRGDGWHCGTTKITSLTML